jgi:hypothetical protein
MESRNATHPSQQSTKVAADFVVLGDSLKMQALRHVLETLEMNVVTDHTTGTDHRHGEIRIAFDGCDPEACEKKATYIQSLALPPSTLLQFPIGRVPQIAPLFEETNIPEHQGTIFDPNVEVYANCWGRLHTFARFVEQSDIQRLKAAPFHATATLEALKRQAATPGEMQNLRRITALVAHVEDLIANWRSLLESGSLPSLEERLLQWNCTIQEPRGQIRAGPLDPFRELVRGLGSATRDFKTAVASLAEMKSATFDLWETHLKTLR